MNKINVDDYDVLECSYCDAEVMAVEYKAPKKVQIGAKDLGINEFVMLLGVCPVCLTVVAVKTAMRMYAPVVFMQVHENTDGVFGSEAHRKIRQIFDSTDLDEIRAGITEKRLFVMKHPVYARNNTNEL